MTTKGITHEVYNCYRGHKIYLEKYFSSIVAMFQCLTLLLLKKSNQIKQNEQNWLLSLLSAQTRPAAYLKLRIHTIRKTEISADNYRLRLLRLVNVL